jgi:hypothetical protein
MCRARLCIAVISTQFPASGVLAGDSRVVAVAGHRYAEHCHERGTDELVVFEVVTAADDYALLRRLDPLQH